MDFMMYIYFGCIMIYFLCDEDSFVRIHCIFVLLVRFVLFFFFFSSRRRHTRSKRDWSSDVCSSDLPRSMATTAPRSTSARRDEYAASGWVSFTAIILFIAAFFSAMWGLAAILNDQRSEERRVGKECRSRRPPYRSRKKQQKMHSTL